MNINTLITVAGFLLGLVVYSNGQATTNAKLEVYQQEAVRRIEAIESKQQQQDKAAQQAQMDLGRIQQDFTYMREALADLRTSSREQTVLIQRILQGEKQ